MSAAPGSGGLLPSISTASRFAALAAVLVGVGWLAWGRIASAGGALDAATVVQHAPRLALAVAAIAGATLLLALTWSAVAAHGGGGSGRDRGLLVLVFGATWLGRYLPGKLPGLAGRVYLAHRLGYPFAPLVVGTGVATAVEAAVAALLAVLFLSLATGGAVPVPATTDHLAIAVAVAVLIPCAALLAGRSARARGLVRAVGERFRAQLQAAPTRRRLAEASLFALLSRLVSGLALYLVFSTFSTVGWLDLPLLVGAASGAAIASMAISIAPGGLGVREGLLVVLLAPAHGAETAAAAAVLFRGLSVVSDVLWLAGALALASLAYGIPLRSILGDGDRQSGVARSAPSPAATGREE